MKKIWERHLSKLAIKVSWKWPIRIEHSNSTRCNTHSDRFQNNCENLRKYFAKFSLYKFYENFMAKKFDFIVVVVESFVMVSQGS